MSARCGEEREDQRPLRSPIAALRWGSASMVWAFVAACLLAAGAAAGAFGLAMTRRPRPPFLDPAPPRAASAAGRVTRPGEREIIAGSGSNIPVTLALVRASSAGAPPRFTVEESIGSTGGVRAVSDGVIALGLVSRALTEDERRLGLSVTPYARVPVIAAAHPGVSEEGIPGAELSAIFAGTRTTWADGTRIVVLQRERGDSSHAAVAAALPGFREIDDDAHRAGRWRVVYSDRAMQEALLTTEGAIGLIDLGAVVSQDLALRVLRIDGVAASEGSVLAGRYPFWKDLSFVSRDPPPPAVSALLAFTRSAEGRAVVRRAGCIPLPLDAAAEVGP